MVALLALLCALFFTLTFILVHVITNNLPPLSSTLSLYALEEYGYILELGFYSIGLTQLLLAFLFFSHIGAKQASFISSFLILSAAGAIAVAVFPTLPPPASIIERLPHILGAVSQFFFFPLAALLLSAHMTGSLTKAYTRLTGFITAFFFIIMLVLFFLPAMKNFTYFGLIEKTNILAINFWLILISYVLSKPARYNKLFSQY